MSECPEMDWEALHQAFRESAWWSVDNPKPQPPELIPGLPGINSVRLRNYWEKLVGWKVSYAERLMYGLPPRDKLP